MERGGAVVDIYHFEIKSRHSIDRSSPKLGSGWLTIKSNNSNTERWGWPGGGNAGWFWATSIIVKPRDQISDWTE